MIRTLILAGALLAAPCAAAAQDADEGAAKIAALQAKRDALPALSDECVAVWAPAVEARIGMPIGEFQKLNSVVDYLGANLDALDIVGALAAGVQAQAKASACAAYQESIELKRQITEINGARIIAAFAVVKMLGGKKP